MAPTPNYTLAISFGFPLCPELPVSLQLSRSPALQLYLPRVVHFSKEACSLLKAYRRQFNILCVLTDAVAILAAFALAYLARLGPLEAWLDEWLREPVFGWSLYLPILFLCGFSLLAALFAAGAYRLTPNRPWHTLFAVNAKAVILAVVLTLAAAGALRLTYLSRVFVALFFLFFLALSTLAKKLLGSYYGRRGLRLKHQRVLILIGCGPQAKQIAETVQNNPELGIGLRGFLIPDFAQDEYGAEEIQKLGLPCLGETPSLPQILQREVVDGVIFSSDSRAKDRARFEELCLLCEDVGVDVLLPVNPFPHLVARVKLERLESFTLLHFTTVSHDAIPLFLKRSLDFTSTLLGLSLLLPLFAVVALLIKATSKGPVFFVQERVGLRGRRFRMVKFRTMVADAEKRLEEVRHLNEVDGPVFKIKHDPRITAVGRFLRMSSIDELPQLWNVLRGDMSLVGPRPPLAAEVENYERWQRRRLSMRPGITCLWQVSGRSNVDFDRWMGLDLEYIDNWSLGLDFLILLKTVPAVFFGRGAS